MTTAQAMWLGVMLAYTPSLLLLALALWRAWQEQQDNDNHGRWR
jgi:hypothetical protein